MEYIGIGLSIAWTGIMFTSLWLYIFKRRFYDRMIEADLDQQTRSE